MPEIEFSNYARQQMLERELNEEVVREAISNSDEIVQGDKGRKVAHKRVNGNHMLRVVFEERAILA